MFEDHTLRIRIAGLFLRAAVVLLNIFHWLDPAVFAHMRPNGLRIVWDDVEEE